MNDNINCENTIDEIRNLEISYCYSPTLVDKYMNQETKNVKQPTTLVALDCFTTFDNPDTAYTAATKKIDISGISQGTFLNSITDGTQTVTFSSNMQKLNVPSGWNNWSSPPLSEDSTPDVLFSNFQNSMTITLSEPSCIFGFEMEANLFGTFPLTVEFYSGNEFVGNIVRTVTSPNGARLFAAKTCCDTPFDRIEIIVPPALGFGIAQVRYSTDCSSECDCCCNEAVDANFVGCEESRNVPIEITNLKCQGRLLIVDVTVTACENRKVAIGVLVCDEEEEDVLRFKVCEACMPESTTPEIPCVENTFRFCFGFETDLCDPLSLKVKTFAEYASFNFECDC
ncbi:MULTISPECIES: hypothetical protein [Clostridium]|uniref:Uncharacterized protein n=1 Tax=Clostridium aquiflavi TaxID=3073603 RepID=A0ABU1EF83_9CLOT|nr:MULTISPECIES: hypothetical protein [unclassified Clostridium]MDR5587051.1 hypothetical protein [Clostridium sp. 5N-1]NFG61255.1 hypothetical protein [Clostridium botulinum]NFQ09274.1 hypothetical protein [Clostridium botulinum]